MTDVATATLNRPAWIDLAAKDAAAERQFYARLFDWDIEVNPDPQYGGYAIARIDGDDVAGIGPAMSPGQPTAWSLYIGSDDLDGLSKRIVDAGGTVVMAPFDVGDQGRMAAYQDPAGAYISAWHGTRMGGFQTHGSNTFGWAEDNAHGVEKVVPFYQRVFGWEPKTSGSGREAYTEFLIDGESTLGATEMSPAFPASVPSHWLVYFTVDDVDTAHVKAIEAGARELAPPADFSYGRMSIVADPEGAAFGMLTLAPG
jgi:predicted enzyme related to lactoylglutathione lyase